MKKIITLLLALTLAAFTLVGCGSKGTSSTADVSTTADVSATETPEKSDELVKVRVSTLAQQLSLPMYYIHEKGWDVENGFELEITTFAQGTGINEALGSGLVDIFTIGAAGISSCSVYDAEYLFSHEDSGAGQQGMVRADSDIANATGYLKDDPNLLGSPETIKGKTFLLPMGTGAQINVDTYLAKFGLTEDDVTLVNMDTAAGYQAFVSGEGDICHTCYPTADEFAPSEYVAAFSMNELEIPYYDNILASRAFYEDESKHDVLVALCEQIIRAAEDFKDDKVLMDTMMAWYDLNGQTCDADAIEHQVLERPFFTYDDLTTIDYTASFKMVAEFYASVGNITDEDLDTVNANIDNTILNEALKAYKADYLK